VGSLGRGASRRSLARVKSDLAVDTEVAPLVSTGHAESPKNTRRYWFHHPPPTPPGLIRQHLQGIILTPASGETRNYTGRNLLQRSARARP
jgi:hypothetical protein